MLKIKSVIILFFLIISTTFANSNDKVSFIDIDFILKNSNLGKSILNEIENLNNKNIDELQNKEKELKKIEEEIKSKKNILSEQEFKKEVDLLKEKIKKYRIYKDKLVKDFEQNKNKKLNLFFKEVNPIIQKFMDKNSIDILLDRKNVFIGKKNSDITNQIIQELNKNSN
tara:strand:+ start:117 stop:626 length:510 start_codon:yes stop_codon:yes gene_type:complete